MTVIRKLVFVAMFLVQCPSCWCQATLKAQKSTESACEVEHLSKQDVVALEDAQSKLHEKFDSSFTPYLQKMNCASVEHYVKSHPGGQLQATALVKYAAENFGGLKVTSEPEGASIEVDGKAWSDSTNAQDAVRTGTRRIKLTKPGYDEELGEAVVNEGKWTTFHRQLKKKK